MEPYYTIAEFYDLEHDDFRDDVEFYLQALGDGPVLEVGAGTGRIMEPLLRSGRTVWGVEPSAVMLERARLRLAPYPAAHLVQSDLREFHSPQRFQTILFSLNALWHFPGHSAQEQALTVARDHLAPAGTIVIDTSNPLTLADRHSDGNVRRRFTSRSEGRSVSACSAAWDDEGEQALRLELWYDESDAKGHVRRVESELMLHYLSRYEMDAMLRLCGLQARHFYGSYELDPYASGSQSLIVMATRF